MKKAHQMTQDDWNALAIVNPTTLEGIIREAPVAFDEACLRTYGCDDWQERLTWLLYSEIQRAFYLGYNVAKGEIKEALDL